MRGSLFFAIVAIWRGYHRDLDRRFRRDARAKLPSHDGQVAVKGVMNGHAFQTVLEPYGRRGHWLLDPVRGGI